MKRLALIVPLTLLTACALPVGGDNSETAPIVRAEDRSMGEVIDDSAIYTSIQSRIVSSHNKDLFFAVNTMIRQGRVLLTGRVRTHEEASEMVNICWQVADVKEVINEIEISDPASFTQGASDEWTEKQLESRLLFARGIHTVNLSVEVENGVAYFLGLVQSQAELDRVLSVARTAKGVKRVVSHLRIAEAQPVAPTTSY